MPMPPTRLTPRDRDYLVRLFLRTCMDSPDPRSAEEPFQRIEPAAVRLYNDGARPSISFSGIRRIERLEAANLVTVVSADMVGQRRVPTEIRISNAALPFVVRLVRLETKRCEAALRKLYGNANQPASTKRLWDSGMRVEEKG